MEVTVLTACRKAGQNGNVSGRPTTGQRGSEGDCPCAGPLPRRTDLCMFIGAEVSLGNVLGCGLQGGIHGGPWVVEKWRLL